MKSIIVTLSLLAMIILINYGSASAQETGSVSYNSEEIKIHVDQFDIVGDLYTPNKNAKFPVIIFVAGDGPSSREQALPLLKTYGYFDLFLKEGFAVLIDDKPGSGKSTGEFSRGKLFQERARIISAWIENLKKHPLINSKQIGLAGGSQAGYIMPLVGSKNGDVAFLICQSCPAMNSINQAAYLIEQQTLCAGLNSDDAKKAYNYYVKSCMTSNYEEYLEAANYLATNPIVKALGWDYIQTKEEFKPIDSTSESLFNPTDILKKIKVPVLALFGEKDKQIDPIQGSEIYKQALNNAGNKFFQVHLIPNVDHTLSTAETGCLSELMKKRQMNEIKLSDKTRTIVGEWLVSLKKHLD